MARNDKRATVEPRLVEIGIARKSRRLREAHYTPASATQRKSISWGLTQEEIDSRLQHCADPDVHGRDCVCKSYRRG